MKLKVLITNVYGDETFEHKLDVSVPAPTAEELAAILAGEESDEDWAYRHLFALTGEGRGGDAGYFVDILESPELPELAGNEFAWGI